MKVLRVVMPVGVGAGVAFAHADDIATLTNSAATAIQGSLNTVATGVIALAAFAMGFGLLLRWARKAVKSS